MQQDLQIAVPGPMQVQSEKRGLEAQGSRGHMHLLQPPKFPSSVVHTLAMMLTAGISSDKADNDTSHCSNSGTVMPPH